MVPKLRLNLNQAYIVVCNTKLINYHKV